jgi:hypothetical protein
MCKGITFVTNQSESGMDTLRVYATVDFSANTSRLDYVEVGFTDTNGLEEVCVCQVLSIFAISKCIGEEGETPKHFILRVTSMKEVNKKGTDRFLPYSLLGYDFSPNCINVKYHMINADTVLALILGYQILIASGIITQHLRNIFFENDIGEYDTPLQIVARAMAMLVQFKQIRH